MKKSLALFVALSLLLGGIGMVSIFGAEASLTTDKTAYGEDEPILVTAVSEGEKDWVGIYYPGQPHSLRWEYVSTVGSGKPFDIRKTSEVNDGAPETLGPGEYVIRLMPDDSTDISQALAEVEITIGDPSDRPVSGGDLTKLHVPKASYAYNEPILVSAEGAGKDWRLSLGDGVIDIGPLAWLEYGFLQRPDISENTGDASRLHVNETLYQSLLLSVGARVDLNTELENGTTMEMDFLAAWRHEMLDGTFRTDSSFMDYGQFGFSTSTDLPGKDAMLVQSSVRLSQPSNVFVEAYVGGEFFQTGYTSANVGIQFGWVF